MECHGLRCWTKDWTLSSLPGGKRACIACVYFEAMKPDSSASNAFAMIDLGTQGIASCMKTGFMYCGIYPDTQYPENHLSNAVQRKRRECSHGGQMVESSQASIVHSRRIQVASDLEELPEYGRM